MTGEGEAALDGHGFLAGGGAMGALMRAHHWAGSPLGQPTGWPSSLRTLVRVMLASRQPMFIAWGPARAMLYNDGYAPICGAKHPWALGRPFAEVWADIIAEVGPIMDRAYAGVSTHMDDIELNMLDRRGHPEKAHFAFSYTPVHDEVTGAVAGTFCACEEITGKVLADQRTAFQLALGDRLRGLSSSREITAVAAELLGRQVSAAQVGYAEVDTEGFATVQAAFNDGSAPSPAGRRYRLDDYGREMVDDQKASRSIVIHDVELDERTASPAVLAAYRDLSLRAFISIPLVKEGRLVAYLYAAHPAPRRWSDSDVAVMRETAERTWAAVERARAEAALVESEARFRNLADNAPVMVWVTEPDATCTYLSRSWYEFTGQTEASGLGLGWLSAIHPDDQAEAERAFLAATAATTPFRLEYRLRRHDGTYHWAIDAAAPRFGAGGEFLGYVGSVIDISDRKAAEDALQRLNGTLEAQIKERTRERDSLWRNSADLLVVLGANGVFRAVNPAWTTILGYGPHELVGRRFDRFVHPEDIESTAAAAAHASHKALAKFENRYRHKDGTYRWFSWTAAPEEGVIYANGRHVTAEKEQAEALRHAEEQLRQSQKMEAVGQLTGGVAHDFNNLLQALSACLRMVERRAGPVAADLRPLVEAGQQAVDRGAKLVQQLMAFARRQALRPEPVNVRDRVLEMSELLARALRGNIAFETEFAPDLWPVLVDPTQFELALINLAVNARDAMPDGGRLLLRADNLPAALAGEASGDAVRISVSDTGTGMIAEVRARAFEPFFTTKAVGQGSGLGLAQVYGFAKQSGGSVAIDSGPGRGTVVTLLLPRASVAPVAAASEAVRPTVTDGVTAGACVLLVEDDPVVADVVAAALEDLSYRVARAASADEALPILNSAARVDLLFSDVVMPGRLNGVDLAREALRLRPSLPVLLTTGYSEDVARAVGLRVLAKPYHIGALVEAVEAALAGAAVAAE